MQIYRQRLDTSQPHQQSLALDYATRQKSRFRADLPDGTAIGVDLARTGVLQDGDLIATDEGEVLKILAAEERLYAVQASDAFLRTRAAYHLGNRHVPLMLTPDALYFEPDHVLAEMLTGLGIAVTEVQQPFSPEGGAYQGHGHHHEHSHTHSHGHDHASHPHDRAG